MHLPSERVFRQMQAENAGLWIVLANDGDELALIIKAPSSAIKGLIAGCQLNLLFGRHGPYLSTGVQIVDIPDAPMLIAGFPHEAEAQQALSRLLRERCTAAFLFNEMDACLAWTNIEIKEHDALRVTKVLEHEPALYSGPFTSECLHAQHCFFYSADPTQTYSDVSTIPLVSMPISLEPWRVNKLSFIGVRQHQTILIDDKDEGEMFERAIWASLESVFPLTLHKSPQVKIGKKTRELIDVFAFHDFGNFLIEAKDLSIFRAGPERDQERRTKGIQKQIKKAIGQLVGACKNIKRGERVFDSEGRELNVARDQTDHCIILITELMHWGDWGAIEEEIMEAMRLTGAYFQLMDLREFITLVKASAGNAMLFDYHLIQRCTAFVQNGNVFVRSQIAPLPPKS